MAWDFALPGSTESPREREEREQREFQRAQRQRVQGEQQKLRQAVTERYIAPVQRVQTEQAKFRQLAGNLIRQQEEERQQNVAIQKEKFRTAATALMQGHQMKAREDAINQILEEHPDLPEWAVNDIRAGKISPSGILGQVAPALRSVLPESVTSGAADLLGRYARTGVETAGNAPLLPLNVASQVTGINPEVNVGGVQFTPLRSGLLPSGVGQAVQEQVSEEGRRILPAATSPLGIASLAALPEATLAGTAGAITAGAVGGLAEEAGFDPRLKLGPFNIGPRSALETAGGLVPGISTIRRPAVDARASLTEENRFLKTLVQEGRATPEQESRLMQVRNELADLQTTNVAMPSGTRISNLADEGVSETANVVDPLQSISTKMAQAIREARTGNVDVKAARSAEKGARGAEYTRILKEETAKGTPFDEADRIASGSLGGEYQPFTGVRVDASPEEVQAFTGRMFAPDVKDFERKNLMTAFGKLSEKQPITDYYMNLIERLYPELGAAIKEASVKKGGFWSTMYDVAVMPKALLSSMDMSYPLRQGVLSAPGHPLEFLDSFAPMVRSFASEDRAQTLYRNAIDDPRILTLADGTQKAMGQAKSDIGILRTLSPELSTSEEAFRSNLAERIPGIGHAVRASNRAFTTFGNEFRSKMFDTIVGTWQRRGIQITDERLQSLGNMLNRFTGRGTLNKQGVTDALQALWWSPQTRVAPAEAIGQLFHADAAIRNEAWRNWAAFLGTGSTILGAAALAGAKVGTDPRSSDFGKVVFGKTHLNIWGPLQPQVRYTAQLLTGARIDATRGALPADRMDTAWRYFRSGLAPEWSAAYDVASGKNYAGQPVGLNLETLKREAPERLFPLAFQDMYEAFKEEGLLAGAFVGPATFFGESVSTYPPSSSQELAAIPRWIGGNFTPREIYTMETLWRRAADNRAAWYKEQGIEATVEDSLRQTARAMNREAGDPKNKVQGKALPVEKNLLDWAIALGTSTKLRTMTPDKGGYLNPEWVKYVVEHEKELTEAGKGDLYARKYIADALRAARGANSGR